MMEGLYTWVKDIFLIIISMSFFQVLIPDSSMEKYLKFIFSIVILAVIAEPIVALFEG